MRQVDRLVDVEVGLLRVNVLERDDGFYGLGELPLLRLLPLLYKFCKLYVRKLF
jgi:hypothetical protein